MELKDADKVLLCKKAREANQVPLDVILTKFKLFGCYHLKTILLISLVFIPNTMQSLNYVFAVEKNEYTCKNSLQACDLRSSNKSALDNFDPRCYARMALDNGFSCAYGNTSKVVPCSEWAYDKPESFIAEFQIACQEWKLALVGTAHSVGYMTGLLVVGPISDRLGRKTVFLTIAVLGGIMGVTKSFLTNYWLYIVFEFFEAVIGDPYSPGYMLMIETVATDDRPIFAMIALLGVLLGQVFLPIAAWFFQYWRNMLRAIYAPSLLFLLYIFYIDESPRWLLTKGRKQEAIDILNKAASMNGIILDNTELENLVCEDKTEINIATMLKNTLQSKVILKRFLVCLVWWICGTFLSNGVAVNAVFLSGNKYTNFILIYLASIPTALVFGYSLKYFKRKIPLILSFFGAAVFFLAHPFLPHQLPWLSLAAFIGGKSMVVMSYNITGVFTSELFPTCTRNSMHALCSSIGRIGSVLSHFTPLLVVHWHGLPSMLFAGTTLLAGLVTLLVPETADNDLPNTVREAEEIGQHGERKVNIELLKKEFTH